MKKRDRFWIAPRELPLQARGRRVMLRADHFGVEVWLKGKHEKHRVSWRTVAGIMFPQIYEVKSDEHRTES